MSARRDELPTYTRRAARATWWGAFEIGSRYVIQFVVMVALARLLVPDDFGLIAMLLVFTTIATLLVDGGFSTALIRQQRRDADDETTVFLTSAAVGFTLAAILWGVAPLVARFYARPELVGLLRLMTCVLPLAALAAVPDAILTQTLRFRPRTVAEGISSVISGAIAISLALRDYAAWSLAWQAVSAVAVRAVALWILSAWWPQGRFRIASFMRLFAFGGYLLLSNLLAAVYLRLQSLLIGRLFDSTSLGHYTMAQNTQQVPAQIASNLLNRVGLPVFSMVAPDRVKFTAALRSSLQLSLFLFVPCMLAIAVMAEPLVVALYGEKWRAASSLLSILALSAAPWPVQVIGTAAMSALGKSRFVFRLELVKRVAAIALILLCAPFGVVAIAWSVLLSSIVSSMFSAWALHVGAGYRIEGRYR